MSDFNYDSIPPGYYDEIYKKESGIQSKWHHLKFRFFEEHIQNSDAVLDIGCGPGTFLGNFNNYAKAVGVDISEQQIEYATEHYASGFRTFRSFDGKVIPFEDNSYDVVVLIEVVEHLQVPTVQALLEEALRVLKPHGRIYVSTPNYLSLWPALEYVLNHRAKVTYESQHINCYKPVRLRRELFRAGFKNTRVRPYQFIAPFLAGLNWQLSDSFYALDHRYLSHQLGFLLLAEGHKGVE